MLLQLLKAIQHKYIAKKKINNKWVYDYGKGIGKGHPKKKLSSGQKMKVAEQHYIQGVLDKKDYHEYVDKHYGTEQKSKKKLIVKKNTKKDNIVPTGTKSGNANIKLVDNDVGDKPNPRDIKSISLNKVLTNDSTVSMKGKGIYTNGHMAVLNKYYNPKLKLIDMSNDPNKVIRMENTINTIFKGVKKHKDIATYDRTTVTSSGLTVNVYKDKNGNDIAINNEKQKATYLLVNGDGTKIPKTIKVSSINPAGSPIGVYDNNKLGGIVMPIVFN